MFDLLALDADDTLWHNERLYAAAQVKLAHMLAPFASSNQVEKKLLENESANIKLYGYGIKSFVLSMIETALQLSDHEIPAAVIADLLQTAKDMISADVELLPGVETALKQLAPTYRLMIITKGDLLDQRAKLERSGIAGYFSGIEVVVEKTADVYRALLDQLGVDARRFLMVGNSLRSDILPVVELGGHAVYIPSELTWEHERVDDVSVDGYHQLKSMDELPGLLQMI